VPAIRNKLTIAAVAAAGALALPQVAAACEGEDADPHEVSLSAIRSATLCLINEERADRGRSRLGSRDQLKEAATKHSRAMDNQNFFSHDSPGGADMVDRVRRTGYLRGAGSWALGENIAWGSGSLATPARIVEAWMNSSGHRDNILSRNFEHIGIGVARGAPVAGVGDGATYTTDFGRR
jgi:uncharacterized protein YkwD